MNMFKPNTSKTPEEYIDKIDEPRRSDILELHKLIIKTVPKFKPFMISGMIGYGSYHYKYPSGREGDWSIVSLASQKNYISLYVSCIDKEKYLAESYKDKLPKASIGKSCIRFKKLEDVDLDVIKEILLKAEKIGGMGKV
jgi:hypothetical protein